MNNDRKFGWSYPAGAANDPNAPYNQEEIHDNSDFEEQFSDFDSLCSLYRAVYKYTDCGPGLGVTVWIGPKDEPKTYYCDNLRKLGTFRDMREEGLIIVELVVSSIVEGVEQCTEARTVKWTPMDVEPAELAKQFWDIVEDTNIEANEIWNDTHGCPECSRLNGHTSLWCDDTEGCDGVTPVNEGCTKCGGTGVPI